MKTISCKQDFDIYRVAMSDMVESTKHIPEQIFNNSFKYFLFLTFDEMLMPLFFNNVRRFCAETKDHEFWLSVLDPDPESYFFENFGEYGILIFTDSDDQSKFINAINSSPKDSPADALIHNSNSILVSSLSKKWAIYGDRNLEIGICAFVDKELMIQFESIYGRDLLNGVSAAADYAFGNKDISFSKEKFFNSYSI